MTRLKLFYRLMVRPLLDEPVRMALTILAVALGVAVVLAIELAGNAAAGSFYSSMETLAGEYTLEVVAPGGVPEAIVGQLVSEPFLLLVSPRLEDSATILETKQTLPLIGIDMIAEGSRYQGARALPASSDSAGTGNEITFQELMEPTSIWVGSSLNRKPGDRIELLINDQTYLCTVRGVYPDLNGSDTAIIMDLAGASRALGRQGRVDRILVKTPAHEDVDTWLQRIRSVLSGGVEVRAQGTGTAENREMLAAFRWNLRLLSYIALVVGAFLIYNTISVSVVRRRADIGIVRALGASQRAIFFAFLGEGAGIGLVGALLGLVLGRMLASGAVRLLSLTVQSLYVSSRPGAISLSSSTVALALLTGVGIAIASALAPAREAMRVPPVDAMARGRREFVTRMRRRRDLAIAAILAVVAALLAQLPPAGGKPLFAYLATLLLIGATSHAIPVLVTFVSSLTSRSLGRVLGVEALLASRSLVASLGRTSILVGALTTAVAMMTSVGIMVGSFRQTVVEWMEGQLPADLYLRPAGKEAADKHPTISLALANTIARLPGVEAIDRLRAYEISYGGMPVTLASVDLQMLRSEGKSDFFSGRPNEEVRAQLRGDNKILASEPFTNKHRVRIGDSIELSLGGSVSRFQIADVFYDYASERGVILMERDTLLKYLPDPAPSNIAVFVRRDADPAVVRREIEEAAAGHHILIFSDRDLRGEAIRIFDRTFAITYALEAIAVVVAVMGIAGALLALIIDRRRELALLKFLGASSGQIRKMILAEAGFIGLLSNAAGIVLGYFLSLILVFIINKQSFGWTIRFHWPIAVLVGALTVVYAATVLAGFYPALIATRLNPLEVIHEE